MLDLLIAMVLSMPGVSGGRAGANTVNKQAVAAAKALLSRELKVDAARVSARKVTATEWPDASLGCPEPGMSYIQMVTPGYKVVLEVAGRSYTVHTAGDRAVRCDKPRAPGASSPK